MGATPLPKTNSMRKLLLAIFLLVSTISFSQFTSGNLALLQADASASNTTCSIIEINKTTPAQSAITTVAIDGTSASALRFSGSATSTGYLATSNDGTLLCFTGANSSNTSANVNTLNPRGVGTLNASQVFNLATTYTGTSGNQTRGATTVDDANWYIGDQGGLYTNGSTTASPTGNVRSVKSFGGIVYGFTASASSPPVFTISAVTGGTFTSLPGLGNGTANHQDFYLISSGSNGSTYDVLYVLAASSNTVGTIYKFSLVSSSWTANGTYTTVFGGFGIAAQLSGGGANLFVSTGQGALTANSVIKLNDAAGFNAAINITTASNVTLYTAPAGKIIKGVAFTPIAAISPSVVPNPATVTFSNTAVGSFSAGQTITLTASNLTPASGSLTATAPNTNFQVSSDGGTTWVNTTTVSYSNNGSTSGNFQVRFSPQSSGAQSGNVTISGGGLSTPATVAVNGTGTNNLSLTFSASTTPLLNPPYVSGTINDAGDPAQQQGIITDVKENGVNIVAANYTLTASSGNTSVVPNANITITKSDGQATIKITPASVGYDDITLTLTSNGNNTTLVIHYAASSSSSSSAGTHWHTSFADASGAIALDDNYMIVCNDENNFLYVFHRDQSGLPVKSFDFNQGNILGLTDGAPGAYKEVDVEAGTSSTTTTGKSYWLGSMSNSSSFNNKPNRNRIFAITTTGTGAATNFANAGSYNNLRQQLITWGDANGYNFTASAADGHDSKVIDGFNLEGMVFAPDNTTLYLGFRAPLVPTANRTKAVIAPIQNFESWFNNGSPVGNPTIGSPIELDLGGRGIRDIIKQSNGNYIIVAGSYDGTSNPAIYNWTGNPANAPQLTTFNVAGLNLEGALQVNESGVLSPNKIQFLSDNGDAVYYGDGIAAKDLTQDNFKKFRSDIIISSGALPIEFVFFTANRQSNNVSLNWEIGQTNLRSFEILRSVNGRDFISVAVVNAMPGQNVYSYNDNNITGDKLYYRIKATEISNREFLSAVRLLNVQSTETAMVYPNPVTNNLFTVSVNNPGEKKLEIYSVNGALYKEFYFTGNTKDVNSSNWQKGYYVIRIITSDGKVSNEKLIIQ